MKRQILQLSPWQNAKLIAVLYLVLVLPFLLSFALVPAFAGGEIRPLLMVGPIAFLYAGVAFVLTLAGANIYNLVAARIGGFEFTTAEVAGD